MRHVIDSLEFEVALPDEERAFAEQETLRRFLRETALQVIEEVFDAWAPAGEVWRIERLDLDLGRVDGPDLVHQWSRRLREQLHEALLAQRERWLQAPTARHAGGGPAASGPGPADEPAMPPRRQSRRQADVEALAHFARQGVLPWHLALAPGQRLADWAGTVVARDARPLVRTLRGSFSGTSVTSGGAVAQRLAGQLPPGALHRLLRAVGWPAHWPLQAWIDAALERARPDAAAAVSLRRRLWALLLAQALAAPGAVPEPRRLRAALRVAARAGTASAPGDDAAGLPSRFFAGAETKPARAEPVGQPGTGPGAAPGAAGHPALRQAQGERRSSVGDLRVAPSPGAGGAAASPVPNSLLALVLAPSAAGQRRLWRTLERQLRAPSAGELDAVVQAALRTDAPGLAARLRPVAASAAGRRRLAEGLSPAIWARLLRLLAPQAAARLAPLAGRRMAAAWRHWSGRDRAWTATRLREAALAVAVLEEAEALRDAGAAAEALAAQAARLFGADPVAAVPALLQALRRMRAGSGAVGASAVAYPSPPEWAAADAGAAGPGGAEAPRPEGAGGEALESLLRQTLAAPGAGAEAEAWRSRWRTLCARDGARTWLAAHVPAPTLQALAQWLVPREGAFLERWLRGDGWAPEKVSAVGGEALSAGRFWALWLARWAATPAGLAMDRAGLAEAWRRRVARANPLLVRGPGAAPAGQAARLSRRGLVAVQGPQGRAYAASDGGSRPVPSSRRRPAGVQGRWEIVGRELSRRAKHFVMPAQAGTRAGPRQREVRVPRTGTRAAAFNPIGLRRLRGRLDSRPRGTDETGGEVARLTGSRRFGISSGTRGRKPESAHTEAVAGPAPVRAPADHGDVAAIVDPGTRGDDEVVVGRGQPPAAASTALPRTASDLRRDDATAGVPQQLAAADPGQALREGLGASDPDPSSRHRPTAVRGNFQAVASREPSGFAPSFVTPAQAGVQAAPRLPQADRFEHRGLDRGSQHPGFALTWGRLDSRLRGNDGAVERPPVLRPAERPRLSPDNRGRRLDSTSAEAAPGAASSRAGARHAATAARVQAAAAGDAVPPTTATALLRHTLAVPPGTALPQDWRSRWRALCAQGGVRGTWLMAQPAVVLRALALRLAPGEAAFLEGWSRAGVWPPGHAPDEPARQGAFWTLWLARWAATPPRAAFDRAGFAAAWLRHVERATGLGREEVLQGLLRCWVAAEESRTDSRRQAATAGTGLPDEARVPPSPRPRRRERGRGEGRDAPATRPRSRGAEPGARPSVALSSLSDPSPASGRGEAGAVAGGSGTVRLPQRWVPGAARGEQDEGRPIAAADPQDATCPEPLPVRARPSDPGDALALLRALAAAPSSAGELGEAADVDTAAPPGRLERAVREGLRADPRGVHGLMRAMALSAAGRRRLVSGLRPDTWARVLQLLAPAAAAAFEPLLKRHPAGRIWMHWSGRDWRWTAARLREAALAVVALEDAAVWTDPAAAATALAAQAARRFGRDPAQAVPMLLAAFHSAGVGAGNRAMADGASEAADAAASEASGPGAAALPGPAAESAGSEGPASGGEALLGVAALPAGAARRALLKALRAGTAAQAWAAWQLLAAADPAGAARRLAALCARPALRGALARWPLRRQWRLVAQAAPSALPVLRDWFHACAWPHLRGHGRIDEAWALWWQVWQAQGGARADAGAALRGFAARWLRLAGLREAALRALAQERAPAARRVAELLDLVRAGMGEDDGPTAADPGPAHPDGLGAWHPDSSSRRRPGSTSAEASPGAAPARAGAGHAETPVRVDPGLRRDDGTEGGPRRLAGGAESGSSRMAGGLRRDDGPEDGPRRLAGDAKAGSSRIAEGRSWEGDIAAGGLPGGRLGPRLRGDDEVVGEPGRLTAADRGQEPPASRRASHPDSSSRRRPGSTSVEASPGAAPAHAGAGHAETPVRVDPGLRRDDGPEGGPRRRAGGVESGSSRIAGSLRRDDGTEGGLRRLAGDAKAGSSRIAEGLRREGDIAAEGLPGGRLGARAGERLHRNDEEVGEPGRLTAADWGQAPPASRRASHPDPSSRRRPGSTSVEAAQGPAPARAGAGHAETPVRVDPGLRRDDGPEGGPQRLAGGAESGSSRMAGGLRQDDGTESGPQRLAGGERSNAPLMAPRAPAASWAPAGRWPRPLRRAWLQRLRQRPAALREGMEAWLSEPAVADRVALHAPAFFWPALLRWLRPEAAGAALAAVRDGLRVQAHEQEQAEAGAPPSPRPRQRERGRGEGGRAPATQHRSQGAGPSAPPQAALSARSDPHPSPSPASGRGEADTSASGSRPPGRAEARPGAAPARADGAGIALRELLQHLFVEGQRHVPGAFEARLAEVLAGRRTPATALGARAVPPDAVPVPGAGTAPPSALPAPATPPVRRNAPPQGRTAWRLGQAPGLEVGEAVTVPNAGLVLLGPYIPRLFSMLELTKAEGFADEAARARAVALLQALVDGRGEAEEHALVLNKLLCGMAPHEPLAPAAPPPQAQLELGEQMLRAVIAHWNKLGQTSVAGLRETFLQREGRLRREVDAWRLVVAPRAFDVLLDFVPWGWRTLKLSWMPEVLHVEWR